MRGVLAGMRLQLIITRQYAESLLPLITAPLYTVIFLMILRHGGRPDLSGYAVIGPVFIALWWYALFQGGLVVQSDRWSETIELHVSTPTRYRWWSSAASSPPPGSACCPLWRYG
jgi:ABC-2 type transport system permease protein